jgi:hypothetical protein
MIDAKQLAAMERAMEEEHRKDREALERLKRFLYARSDGKSEAPKPLSAMDRIEQEVDELNTNTIIGRVETIFVSDPDRRWTVPTMLQRLQEEKFPLAAEKPIATLGLVFSKLHKRGKIKRVKRGSGRTPHIYRANVSQEPNSETEAKSERPTQGQAVAVQ